MQLLERTHQNIKQDLDVHELRRVQGILSSDPHIQEANKALGDECINEMQDFKVQGHLEQNDSTYYLIKAFKALDEIAKIQVSYERYIPGKSEPRLGTRNKFLYFGKSLFLDLKRAVPEIEKIFDKDKKERLRQIFSVLEEFTFNHIMPFIKGKSILERAARERNARMGKREKLQT